MGEYCGDVPITLGTSVNQNPAFHRQHQYLPALIITLMRMAADTMHIDLDV